MKRHRLWLVLVLVAAVPSAGRAESWPPVELYTITPCRIADTRTSEDGPLRPGAARWLTLDGCGIPTTAYAAVLNVTVVDTVGQVDLTAFPGDLQPGSSTLVSASPSAPTRAALAILPLATDGTGSIGFLGFFDSPSGQAHLVVDITGYFAVETIGSSEMPGADDTGSTLGLPDELYAGDPALLDDPSQYEPGLIGVGPSHGHVLDSAPVDCRQYTGGPVTPLGIRANAPRYFSYAGKIQLLVGASADVACHFRYTKNNPMLDKCNSGPSLLDPPASGQPVPSPGTHYEQVLTDLKNAGFNKTRLWVALGYESDRENLPFLWDAQGGYWRLDQKNQDYFDRIRAVVSKAKALDMFVEVTFFAPFQGPRNGFSASPWSWNANLARALDPGQAGPPTRAGFTSHYYAAIHDTRNNAEAARNERMRQYQRNVIEWTIEELWCYDNVYWEIANEPEEKKLYPLNVAAWQKSMIAAVRQEDCPANAPDCTDRLSALTRRHLIAVQPFTRLSADSFLLDAHVAVLNSHYTHILSDPIRTLPNPPGEPSQYNLGAIEAARTYANQIKVLGYNEGKITPLNGTSGTRSHVNGVVGEGTEAARAEAWEFLFYRGGTLDHWGYLSKDGASSPTVGAIRQQLAALKAFMLGSPLEKLRTSANPPNWIVNNTLNKYPTGTQGWDATRSSQRYWAGLQADETSAAGRWFLLYMHHSTRRCYDPRAQQERDFTAGGCDNDNDPSTVPPKPGPYMTFGGYDARVWTTPHSKRYRATFNIDLGPNPGTFDVFWINPASLQAIKQQALAWRQSSCSLPGCILCSNPSASNPCSIALGSTEGYDFDVVLKIVQRP